jgi:hypothetical protein
MHLKPTAAIMAVTLLALASLACNAVTGGGLNNAQATANAVLTAAVSGDSAATASEATAAAAQATADALINAPDEATATARPTGDGDATPNATEAPAGTGNEAPSDVPIIDAQNSDFFATASAVSYLTDADFKTTVSFYKDAMPNNGWTLDANTSIETDSATILYYTKDNRQATVTLTPGTQANTTLVLITIFGN